MQPIELKKDIYWVGCVYYDHRDFHGYSTSPEGTTYNAYVIKDEKNVLFDTVSPGCFRRTKIPGEVDWTERRSSSWIIEAI